MRIINLTPHNFTLYYEFQFINLKSVNPTTWIADGIEGDPVLIIPSEGELRIKTSTTVGNEIAGIPTVITSYGDLTGLPDYELYEDDVLIVSLPTQSTAKASGHYLAGNMASPYKVVRFSENTSIVLGAMGLSFQ